MTTLTDMPRRIVIPCRRTMHTLPLAVAGIKRANLEQTSIVLVDDGDNPGIEEFASEQGLELRKTDGGCGAGFARNRGAEDFDHGVLIFVDADVEVDPNALADLVRPILEGSADATVGRYSGNVTGLSFAQAYKQRYLAFTYGKPSGLLYNQFWTALGAVDAALFQALGGLPDQFAGAGPEDIAFGVRLSAAGKRIKAVPSATGHHLATFTLASLLKNDFRKGSEDIYIHLTTGAKLTDNRHADPGSITAVAAVGIASFAFMLGKRSLSLLMAILWLAVRLQLITVLASSDRTGWRKCVPLTFLLDGVRGTSVITGSILAAVEWISGGQLKPFQR